MIQRVNNAGEAPYLEWEEKGIKVVLYDMDGTLAAHRELKVDEEVKSTLIENRVPEIFPQVAIATDHEKREHVDEFAKMFQEELGFEEVYPVSVGHGFPKKPRRPMAQEVADHFQVEFKEMAVVGDKVPRDYLLAVMMGAGAMALCHEIGEDSHRLRRWRVLAEDAIIRVANLQEIGCYGNGNGSS